METAAMPLERRTFDATKLFAKHPPVWSHPNKQAVYEISCPEGCVHEGKVEYSRWRQMRLPDAVEPEDALTRVEPHSHAYNYEPVMDDPKAVEWHVNFADPQLFVAYGTGLFAQDEIQVAEHPVLGAVREALDASGMPAVTTQDGYATPVLIMGAQRRCRVATNPSAEEGRPYGLYGNDFAEAEPEAIRRATTPVNPPTMTNLIAMAAPAGGFGDYAREEIEYILGTAYTGFRAAGIEAGGAPVAVHTGFWGCGAFGGDRVLMAMLQVLAAGMAELDRLVFHTFDDDGRTAFDEALERIREDLCPAPLPVEELLDRITKMAFEWGVSDGN